MSVLNKIWPSKAKRVHSDEAALFFKFGTLINDIKDEDKSRERNKTCTYMTRKESSSQQKWLCVTENSIHLRVYEPNLDANTSLAFLVYVPEDKKFIINCTQEFDNSTDALKTLYEIITHYADDEFMKILDQKLNEQNIDFYPELNETSEVEPTPDSSAQATAQTSQISPIK